MMKKEKITVWTLIPNQYEWNIHLCLSKKTFKELIPIFNKNYNLDFNNEQMHELINDNKNDCTLFNIKNKTAIIVLRNYTKKSHDYSTIAHEIFHVASMIAQQLQIPMDYDSTTEVWAYFISFYMDVIIQTLNEYLKEQKKKKS